LNKCDETFHSLMGMGRVRRGGGEGADEVKGYKVGKGCKGYKGGVFHSLRRLTSFLKGVKQVELRELGWERFITNLGSTYIFHSPESIS
jgi:hypothetical protein